MSEFLTYTKFYSREEAQEFIDILQNSGIDFKIDHERDLLDKIYTGESVDPMISLKIPENRFEDINAILLSRAHTQLTDIDPNYYLFSFSDQELIDVLNGRNECNHFDQALAHKLLSDRKVKIPNENKIALDAESYSPLHLGSILLISQYLLTLLLPYVGVIVGLATLFAYKTLKSGEKAKMYDEATRQNAKVMLGLGIIRTLYIFLGSWIYYKAGA